MTPQKLAKDIAAVLLEHYPGAYERFVELLHSDATEDGGRALRASIKLCESGTGAALASLGNTDTLQREVAQAINNWALQYAPISIDLEFTETTLYGGVLYKKGKRQRVAAREALEHISNGRALVRGLHRDSALFCRTRARPVESQPPESRDTPSQPVKTEISYAFPHWEVVRPKVERDYTEALTHFVVKWHEKGNPPPTARDVLDAWKTNPPHGIKVYPNGREFECPSGGAQPTKIVSSDALSKAIKKRVRLLG